MAKDISEYKVEFLKREVWTGSPNSEFTIECGQSCD